MLSSYILRLFIFSWLATSDKSLVWVARGAITGGRTTPAKSTHSLEEEIGSPLPDPLSPRGVAAWGKGARGISRSDPLSRICPGPCHPPPVTSDICYLPVMVAARLAPVSSPLAGSLKEDSRSRQREEHAQTARAAPPSLQLG